jgi:hypothetical protein
MGSGKILIDFSEEVEYLWNWKWDRKAMIPYDLLLIWI